jgi:hypothetical protein
MCIYQRFQVFINHYGSTTSREWRFPTKSKRPPLAIVSHFVRTITRANYPYTRMRVDEGGELARSKSFMTMCFDKLEITVESTGVLQQPINVYSRTTCSIHALRRYLNCTSTPRQPSFRLSRFQFGARSYSLSRTAQTTSRLEL